MREKSMRTKIIARNKRAWHNYKILEKVEAGIQLLGSEVKSLREGKVSLADSFARIDKGEVFLYNMHISPYSHSTDKGDPTRSRKLLLHRREIEALLGKLSKGLSLIPLSLYFKRGRVKVELAFAIGKREFDKREAIKKREAEREIRKRLKK
ncbi:MAG: SsrA-binding protein SmpB [Candidatus Omnitrophica bacterium]|nr:SsrA-binding protein SmpB [Candidatus Omnitrophota bacterium]